MRVAALSFLTWGSHTPAPLSTVQLRSGQPESIYAKDIDDHIFVRIYIYGYIPWIPLHDLRTNWLYLCTTSIAKYAWTIIYYNIMNYNLLAQKKGAIVKFQNLNLRNVFKVQFVIKIYIFNLVIFFIIFILVLKPLKT